MAPIEISDETLALDLINELAHKGKFLAHEHTMTNFRKIWSPDLFLRNNYDSWEKAGSKDFTERATRRLEKILTEHKPDPLPEDIAKAVNVIVQRAKDK